jgi:hypothetical protein
MIPMGFSHTTSNSVLNSLIPYLGIQVGIEQPEANILITDTTWLANLDYISGSCQQIKNTRQMVFTIGEIIRRVADESMKSMRNSFSMQANGRILKRDWG